MMAGPTLTACGSTLPPPVERAADAQAATRAAQEVAASSNNPPDAQLHLDAAHGRTHCVRSCRAGGPAAQVAPTDLHIAQEILIEAERFYSDEGDGSEARDMAYTAEQRAHIAEARALSVQALQQRQRALGQLETA